MSFLSADTVREVHNGVVPTINKKLDDVKDYTKDLLDACDDVMQKIKDVERANKDGQKEVRANEI